jgi:predicted glycosyltransferase
MVDPRELSPETLRAAIERALHRPPRPAASVLTLDGATRVADHLCEAAAGGTGAVA